jgi:hypothetical protein
MLKNIFYCLFFLILTSCSGDSSDTIYKTKGGDFGSKTGKFIADFPTKPNHSVIENQIGLEKFQLHLFRSTLGVNKIFSIEYVDYPEYMIKSTTDEELYNQAITNLSNKMSESFTLERKEAIEQHDLKGQSFTLKLNESAINKGAEGFIKGSVFKKGNRFYTIMYIGTNDINIGSFLKSFRLLN